MGIGHKGALTRREDCVADLVGVQMSQPRAVGQRGGERRLAARRWPADDRCARQRQPPRQLIGHGHTCGCRPFHGRGIVRQTSLHRGDLGPDVRAERAVRGVEAPAAGVAACRTVAVEQVTRGRVISQAGDVHDQEREIVSDI